MFPKSVLRYSVVCALLLAGLSNCSAAEAYKIPWDTLHDAASRYLDAQCPKKDREAMLKKLKQRTEQKMLDREMDEDQAMREVMLEWAVGNDGKIRRKEKKAVQQACFYFVTFIDKGYLIPNVIRDRLDKKAVDEILEHLEAEIKAKK